MSASAAKTYLKGISPRSKQMQPIMFFGTLEVAWMSPANFTSWQVGLDRQFDARKDKRLLLSIKQVNLKFSSLKKLKSQELPIESGSRVTSPACCADTWVYFKK